MTLAVELFIWSNLAFLGVDIALAHAENGYARAEEWLPLGFSAIAVVLLLPALFGAKLRDKTRWLALFVGAMAILIGVAGMIYHLSSAFFEAQTLANLVYAAPFVAPLAYVGVGLLLLLTRLEPPASWGGWILFLTLGGFAGNFALSLLDHAQNGFARKSEWIPVAGAAFATSFLAMAVIRPADRLLSRATAAVLGAQVLIGGAGFALHLAGNAQRPGPWLDRLLHGAPLFAPLLFANLALLGALGLWARTRAH
jgi:hypothetical protein